jgi:hypothetical protein
MGATASQGACVQSLPCFACCGYEEEFLKNAHRRVPQSLRTLRTPGLAVELAVSALAGLKGAAGYHTSIVLDGEEYVFTPMGITRWDTVLSHKKNPEMQRIAVGMTKYSGIDLIEFLDSWFPPGHYDLLRKNCNSFTDCALYFLCEVRLDPGFRQMERLGKLADDHYGFVQSISGGEYQPNPAAVDFEVERIIQEIDAERETCDGGSAEADLEFPELERDVFAGFHPAVAESEELCYPRCSIRSDYVVPPGYTRADFTDKFGRGSDTEIIEVPSPGEDDSDQDGAEPAPRLKQQL